MLLDRFDTMMRLLFIVVPFAMAHTNSTTLEHSPQSQTVAGTVAGVILLLFFYVGTYHGIKKLCCQRSQGHVAYTTANGMHANGMHANGMHAQGVELTQVPSARPIDTTGGQGSQRKAGGNTDGQGGQANLHDDQRNFV